VVAQLAAAPGVEQVGVHRPFPVAIGHEVAAATPAQLVVAAAAVEEITSTPAAQPVVAGVPVQEVEAAFGGGQQVITRPAAQIYASAQCSEAVGAGTPVCGVTPSGGYPVVASPSVKVIAPGSPFKVVIAALAKNPSSPPVARRSAPQTVGASAPVELAT
jgi:hypothetical protein